MARTFNTGTATGASASATALAFLATIKALIIANSKWTFVETVTPTGAQRDVYQHQDGWYLVLSANLSSLTGTIEFSVGETYNSTTHVLSKYCQGVAASQTLAADGTGTGTVTLSSSNAQTGGALTSAVFGTTSDYWVVVDDYEVYLGIKTSAVWGVVGAQEFDTTVDTPATNDPLPIVVHSPSNNGSPGSGGGAAVCRLPYGAAGSQSGYPLASWQPGSANAYELNATLLTGLTVDKMNNSQARVCRLTISIGDGASPSTLGKIRGRYKGMVATGTGTTATWLDTITVGGVDYVYAGGSASSCPTWVRKT